MTDIGTSAIRPTDDPPCRICGVRRDPHGTMLVDHRFRAERYCEPSDCGRVATFYVDGVLMCPAHKGTAVRYANQTGHDLRLERIRKDT